MKPQLPPHDNDAEKSVLGGLLLFNQYIDDVTPILKPEHFYHDAHQRIYKHILKLHGKGKAADGVTVFQSVERAGEVRDIGGWETLDGLLQAVPHAAHSRYYAEIVREKWAQRELVGIGSDIVHESLQSGKDASEILESASNRLMRLTEDAACGDDLGVDAKSLMVLHHDEMLRRYAGEAQGVPSGLPSLDAVTQGFMPGTVTVIAARPGVGKTALLCNMLLSMEAHHPLFFSLEQPKLQIADRLVSITAGLGLKPIRRGRDLTEAERERYMDAANRLAEFPCMIADKPGRTVTQITAISRVWKRRKNIGVVFIDYLQLIAPDDRRAPREQQVGDISRGIAAMAKDLHIPVVLLAQMNREIEKRQVKDKVPRLSDLRESGAIEQDAFTIIALDNPSQYDPAAPPTVVKAYVLKNRDGERGVIDLTWNPETVTFSDNGNFAPISTGFFSQDGYAMEFGVDEPKYEANYGQRT